MSIIFFAKWYLLLTLALYRTCTSTPTGTVAVALLPVQLCITSS
ncbi:hypothetical protein [Ancylothrix sp. D3o]|nr:hypothetical protein [Ancylothrix sp. D3o]